MIPTTVFEAANLVEAHMVQDLLRQQGLQSHVEGEYLQGAMGELPARGLVRVVVDAADAVAARRVIAEFEAAQPADPVAPRPERGLRGIGRLGWAGLGLLLGVMVTAGVLRAPAAQDGVDHDRDGVLDERWTIGLSGRLQRIEDDRNLDRRLDAITHFDGAGTPVDGSADDDFDGRFETQLRYRRGQIEASEVDADGDGFAELRFEYRHGVATRMSVIEPSTGRAIRVEHYRLGQLTTAEVDTDRDGTLDTRLRHDRFGDVVERAAIARP